MEVVLTIGISLIFLIYAIQMLQSVENSSNQEIKWSQKIINPFDSFKLDPFMKAVKNKYKLKARFASPRIFGKYKGIYLDIVKVKTTTGVHRSVVKYDVYGYRVSFSFKSSDSFLVKQDNEIFHLFTDIDLGDPSFDYRMYLRSEKEEQMILFLNRESRNKINTLLKISHNFNFSNKGCVLELPYTEIKTQKQFFELLDNLHWLSERYLFIVKNKDNRAVLLENIHTEKDSNVKIKNIELLGLRAKNEDKNAKDLLQKILANEKEKMQVKIVAAKFLGQEGEEYLLQALQSTYNLHLVSIADALNECGTKLALPIILKLFKTIPDIEKQVKKVLQKTIETIKEREQLGDLNGGISLPELNNTTGALSDTQYKDTEGAVSFKNLPHNEKKGDIQ